MSKIILLSLAVLFSSTQINAQSAFSYLNQNNVNCTLSTGAVFFSTPATSSASYEYPAQSGNHLIYANSFWFCGKDAGGQIKVSGQKYIPGTDMFPGPLTTDGTASIGSAAVAQYDQIWTVTKAEIDYHIDNYFSSAYTPPNSILDWPAHGDVSLGQDFYLAPFVDRNNNGEYDPINGDYPLIRGDEASYMILNDKADVHSETGGDPIGIECHFMFYQYNTTDDLDNTTFVNIKMINRGTQTLYDFSVGSFLDTDLGDSNDDFMGCDSTLNLLYAYNGTNTDTQYGSNPPAIGMISLSEDLGTAGLFSSALAAMEIPSTPAEYHLNMTGYFNDGTPRTLGGSGYGGTTPNKFQYHGNPNNSGEWSEINEGNFASDRRMFCAIEPFTLMPYQEICLDFAYVVGDGGNNLENVNNLMAAATAVQTFFDDQNFACENYEDVMSVDEKAIVNFSVYPQPANQSFKVDAESQFDLEIFSLTGELVYSQKNVLPNTSVFPNISAGSYLLKVIIDGHSEIRSVVMN